MPRSLAPTFAFLREVVENCTPEQLQRFAAQLPPEDVAVLEQVVAEIAGRRSYRDDPARWARECINWPDGEGPTPYQDLILGELREYGRVAVRGPHGIGKTGIAAWVVLWFATTRDPDDWKIPTTASVWRQLSKYLWPEIHKWSKMLRWDRLGRPPFRQGVELLDLSLKLSGGEAFAAASDDPAQIEGAHANSILYVFDESKAIADDTFDAAEGAFSGAGGDTDREAYALAISTPGPPTGRFYRIHKREPGFEDWRTIHVTLDDAIAAGRVSAEWAEQRARQWGRDSAVYKNRVEGEFAASDEDGVIPLAWVELANERWRDWVEDLTASGVVTACGVDVARYGDDKTVLALRCGPVLAELREFGKLSTMQTVGHVKGVNTRWPAARIVVDVIGVGAGVVDRLREWNAPVLAFNASESTELRDRSGELGFTNKRSAAWWMMRELLDPENGENVALPPNDMLTGDLCAPTWRVVSGGKIQVESTDKIKERLGRSPDHGSACVMAYWAEYGAPLVAVQATPAERSRVRRVLDDADLMKMEF